MATMIYRIHDVISSRACEAPVRLYALCDPLFGLTELGFSQPVSLDFLRPVKVSLLTRPTAEGKTRTRIADKTDTAVNQCLDGKIYVKFDKGTSDRLFDISRSDYQWMLDS